MAGILLDVLYDPFNHKNRHLSMKSKMAVFIGVSEDHLHGEATAKEIGVGPIHSCLCNTKKIFIGE